MNVRRISTRILNLLIVISILLIALLMKSEGFYIGKVFLCLFIFWTIRLLLNRRVAPSPFTSPSLDRVKIIVAIVFFWRAYENYCDWDKAIPGNLLIYLIVEFSLVLIVYFLFNLERAKFSCLFLLWMYPYADFIHSSIYPPTKIENFGGGIYGNLGEELRLLNFSPLTILIFFLGGFQRKGFIVFLIVSGLAIWINGHGLIFSFFFPLFCILYFISCARGLDILLWNKITNKTVFDRNITLAVILLLFFSIVREDIFRINGLRLGRSIYEWTGLLHETGEAAADSDAVYRYATFYNGKPEGFNKLAAFGPYQYFFSGRYKALYRLKVGSNAGHFPVCHIDVSTNGGAEILAHREIYTDDFQKMGAYEYFSLSFNLTGLTELEFRVKASGEIPFWLDFVKVVRRE